MIRLGLGRGIRLAPSLTWYVPGGGGPISAPTNYLLQESGDLLLLETGDALLLEA